MVGAFSTSIEPLRLAPRRRARPCPRAPFPHPELEHFTNEGSRVVRRVIAVVRRVFIRGERCTATFVDPPAVRVWESRRLGFSADVSRADF
jgi:hypothetical protein